MCQNHGHANGSEAVKLLAEAKDNKDVCEIRYKYLLEQTKSLIAFLNDQDKDGREICKGIYNAHLKDQDMDRFFTELYFTTFREESENFYELDAENHAQVVNMHIMGMDKVKIALGKAVAYTDVRIEDDYKQHQGYWGQAHRIAYQAFIKDLNQESEYGCKKFEAGCKILDKAEELFDPEAKDRKRLPYSMWKMLTGTIQVKQEDGTIVRKLDPKSFRAKLNMNRFQLFILTHEQWAYLANWLNVLTSWVDLETKEIKQYPCIAQNVMCEEKYVHPDDCEYEVVQTWYTRD